MENTQQQNYPGISGSRRSGRVAGGILIIVAGTVLLLQQAGLADFPYWLFSWEILLILIGLYVGFRSHFRSKGWIILLLIGSFFLADDFLSELSIRSYLWPVALIVAGFFVIFSSGKKKSYKSASSEADWEREDASWSGSENKEPYIESVTVFGSIKKNIITKNFKGGEIVTFFGGAEYNLSQADIEGDVVLEMVQIFGGARLVIPPHWEVKSELVAIIGGIEDKRPPQPDILPSGRKRLILKGVSIFGGLDLRSY